jgi:D-sedoheptulose 7-phosphate isomerase
MSDPEAARHLALGAIAATNNAAEALISDGFDDLWSAFELLRDTFSNGHHVYICGNGGSAGDAQHFATELVVRLDAPSKRRPLPATALTTDTAILTAASNDFGFERVFAQQVEARAKSGDCLVMISTSGNSPNLLKAAEVANSMSVSTLALLGKGGGRLKSLVDCAVVVPSDSTQRVQEVHLFCLHMLCEWLEPVFSE